MATMAQVSYAQFFNSGKYADGNNPSVMNFAAFSFSPGSFYTKFKGESLSEFIPAISISYERANSVSSIPLYVGYGLGLQYGFKNEKDGGYKYATNFLSFRVPVEVMYKLNIPGTALSVIPSLGFDPVLYVLGNQVVSHDGNKQSENIFGGNREMRRFNLDWHVAARVMYSQIFLGIGYESPIVAFYNKDNTSIGIRQVNISVGYCF